MIVVVGRQRSGRQAVGRDDAQWPKAASEARTGLVQPNKAGRERRRGCHGLGPGGVGRRPTGDEWTTASPVAGREERRQRRGWVLGTERE